MLRGSSKKRKITFDRSIQNQVQIFNNTSHVFKKIRIGSGYISTSLNALRITDNNPSNFGEIILPHEFRNTNINEAQFPIITIANEESELDSEYEFITLKNNDTIRIPKSKVLGHIDFLLENEVFVYGSNSLGSHWCGAAKNRK